MAKLEKGTAREGQSSGRARLENGKAREGHGFSHADEAIRISRALAPAKTKHKILSFRRASAARQESLP
jgi:hypothetical protein